MSPLNFRDRRSRRSGSRTTPIPALCARVGRFAPFPRCCSPPSSSRWTLPTSSVPPAWPGVNAVRPYYEGRVLAAKPYQVWRRRPPPWSWAVPAWKSASTRGTPAGSTATHSISRCRRATATPSCWPFCTHRGPALRSSRRLSGSTSSATTSILISDSEILEARFADGISAEFAQFLNERIADRREAVHPCCARNRSPPESRRGTKRSISRSTRTWRRRLRATILVGPRTLRTGRMDPASRRRLGSGRLGRSDICRSSRRGARHRRRLVSRRIPSLPGRARPGRLGGFQPADWNEERYLATNPDARNRLAQGTYRTGYLHYVALGLLARGSLEDFRRDDLSDGCAALAGPQRNDRSSWASFPPGPLPNVGPRRSRTVLRQSRPAAFDRSRCPRLGRPRRGRAPAGRTWCAVPRDAGRGALVSDAGAADADLLFQQSQYRREHVQFVTVHAAAGVRRRTDLRL